MSHLFVKGGGVRYRVYYHMHMAWEVVVDAENEDEAMDKADALAGESKAEDYAFIDWEQYGPEEVKE